MLHRRNFILPTCICIMLPTSTEVMLPSATPAITLGLLCIKKAICNMLTELVLLKSDIRIITVNVSPAWVQCSLNNIYIHCYLKNY